MPAAIRVWCLGFFLAVAPAASGLAASGYDLSDTWWNPSESGWGMQLFQQRDTVFATLYVYDAAGRAHWYSGALAFSGLTPQQRTPNYEGELFETTGTWLGAPVFQTPVTYRRVGVITIAAQSMTRATLVYSVDGVTVSKAIERMTFRYDDYAGRYSGSFVLERARCDNPALDGTVVRSGSYVVDQSGTAMTVVADWPGKTCSYAGTYTQDGRLGTLTAGYTCSDGERGTLVFEEMNIQRFAWAGRLFGLDNAGCHLEGRFAAARL